MSDFKKAVFSLAAVGSGTILLAAVSWKYHDAICDAIATGAVFLVIAIPVLIGGIFIAATAVAVALSLWFALEWCCRKTWGVFRMAWGLFRRWRVRA